MPPDSIPIPPGFAADPNVGAVVRSDRARSARRKGQTGEREILKELVAVMTRVEMEFVAARVPFVAHSEDVKRNTLQSDRGGFDIHGVPLLAVEVKRVEALALGSWVKQAQSQAKRGELPVLFYRQSKAKWKVQTYAAMTDQHGSWVSRVWCEMSLDQFLEFYAILYGRFLAANPKV
jgi:hypothetical protein